MAGYLHFLLFSLSLSLVVADLVLVIVAGVVQEDVTVLGLEEDPTPGLAPRTAPGRGNDLLPRNVPGTGAIASLDLVADLRASHQLGTIAQGLVASLKRKKRLLLLKMEKLLSKKNPHIVNAHTVALLRGRDQPVLTRVRRERTR